MNIETMTVKELLDMFRTYNKNNDKTYSMLCLYSDGSGRILKFSAEGWNDLRSAMYDYPDATPFDPWNLIKLLAGE